MFFRKRSRFLSVFLIFVCACALAGGIFLIYVLNTVKKYDRILPERTVEAELERISAAAARGEFVSELNFAEQFRNKYENKDYSALERDYEKMLADQKLEYRQVSVGEGSEELVRAYAVLLGEKKVGTVTLEGKNPRTRLFFFSSADWSVRSFEPSPSVTVYNLKIYKPDDTTVTINGIEPFPEDKSNDPGTPGFDVEGLLFAPEIVYKDKNGRILEFTSQNNIVKPICYDYNIKVPEGIAVYVNGVRTEPVVSGKSRYLRVMEMEKPDVVLKDLCGGTYKYTPDREMEYKTYTAVVPKTAEISGAGGNIDSFCAPADISNKDWESLSELAGIKQAELKEYKFAMFSDEPVLTYKNGASTSEFTMDKSVIEIIGDGTPVPEMPDEIARRINVLYVAELWSKYLSVDLFDDMHGFYQVSPYLIPGTKYYNFAYNWATGVDIEFNSEHYILGFSEETVDSVVLYGDDCFSCRVRFIKNVMVFDGTRLDDVFDSIIYFVKSDGKWKIAVMRDNIEEVG